VKAIVVLNTGPGFRDPEKREGWNERSRRNAHRFGVPIQATNLNLQEDSVVMEHLADMEVPTLVLAGALDRPEYTSSGEYLERKMPHAHLEVIAGGEHNMQETHAAPVVEAIERFVAGL
jgi:pimeloyl-ACP methyl ester carboxylesterase